LNDVGTIMNRAWRTGVAIPAFNIPYLPMMAPVVNALADCDSFGLIAVARLEWMKFESHSPTAVRDEYEKVKDEKHVRLHLDHVPVIDEDDAAVDFLPILRDALDLGYQSIMVDGSRLPLEGNMAATRAVVEMAHDIGVPVEAELGAVMGHEAGPMPPYEELFASGLGFTDPDEARRFVDGTGVDWLSVAVGSVHGAISPDKKDKEKIRARINIDRLKQLNKAIGIPLVLHGGTGIRKDYILDAVENGIAKINVATAIRQPYERLRDHSISKAQGAVYEVVTDMIKNKLEIAGSAKIADPGD